MCPYNDSVRLELQKAQEIRGNEMTPIYLLSGIFMDFLEIESTRCAKSMA